MLAELLRRIAEEFVYARGKPFSGSDFANLIRKDLSEEAKKQLIFTNYDLMVKSSPGNGRWASVPWLAFFDPLVTDSAQRGFYVVF